MVGIGLFPVPPDEDGLAGVDISEERGRLAPQPCPEGDGDGEPPGGQVAGTATNTAQAPTAVTQHTILTKSSHCREPMPKILNKCF